MSRLMTFCGVIPPQPKRIAICSSLTSSVDLEYRPICSSFTSSVEQECCLSLTWKTCSQRLLFVQSVRPCLITWKRGARALSSLEWVFALVKIISSCIIILIRWRFYHYFYVLKEKLLIFRRACVQNFTPAVSLSPTSVYLWNIGTILPRLWPLNHFVYHEISQLYGNKPRSKHRVITVKSRQL